MLGLSSLSVRYKMALMAITALFFTFVIALFVLQQQKQSTLLERKTKVQAQVDSAMAIARSYLKQSETLGQEKAQSLALEAIRAMRYEGSNYLWISDSASRVVMHPIKPELAGKDLSNYKDVNGKLLFREFSKIGQEQGQGFTNYAWTHPENNQIADKMSFVSRLKEWDWIIGSGLWIQDIEETFQKQLISLGFATCLVSLCLLGIFFWVGRDITQPLMRLRLRVNEIANGDLTHRLNEKRGDELGDVCAGIDQMLDQLQSTLVLAKQSSSGSAAMAKRIASASEESATSVKVQHLHLEQLATAMQQMVTTIANVAYNAEQASAATQQVVEMAGRSSSLMQETSQTIERAASEVDQADQVLTSLAQSIDDISQIINVIETISEQTNLLALNAAIEAARAGEQGRGFAVVADEVRGLASRTQDSTEEVQGTLEQFNKGSTSALQAMHQSHETVSQTTESVAGSKEQLDQMLAELGSSSEMVTQIATAAAEQDVVAEEVNKLVVGINQAVDEVSRTSESLAQDSQQLARLANDLDEQLEYFKVEEPQEQPLPHELGLAPSVDKGKEPGSAAEWLA